MGLLALLMVGGMAYQFTPALRGGGQGLFGQKSGTPALKVNGETVTAEDLDSMRRGNALLSSNDKGVLGDDFRTLDRNVDIPLPAEVAAGSHNSRHELLHLC